MRIKFLFPTAMFLSLILSHSATATITNTADYLILQPGDTLQASGVIYKNVSIVVYPGARLELFQDSTDASKWSLQLIAPVVYVGGTISANDAGFSTQGCGLSGSGTQGPGGSGFGGMGGNGNYHANSGGSPYDTTYRENSGSKGVDSLYGGGGNLRIDAINLTVGSTGIITSDSTTGNGGSGGGIFLNGITTSLLNGYTLRARGADGQTQRTVSLGRFSFFIPGGGGGSGGRIKTFRYPYPSAVLYHNYGGTVSVSGGDAGGGTATAGALGQFSEYPGYNPATPSLLAPDESQVVGRAPTLNFMSADNQASQFFRYFVQISGPNDPGFSSPTLSANQMSHDATWPGWQGKPYFKSSQMASFKVPWDLLSNTDYYWRVWVTNSEGNNWSSVSSVRSFHTIDNNRPVTPGLVFPPNGLDNVSKLPSLQILSADPDGNSLTFSLLLSQDPGLSNPKIIESSYPGWNSVNYPSAYHYAGITATCQIQNTVNFPDALEPGAVYYWQAVAYDQYQETKLSDIGTFAVVPRPGVPELLAPDNPGIVTTRTPGLQTRALSPGGALLQFKLEISPDNFATITTYFSGNGAGWNKSQYGSGETALLAIPEANALIPGKTYSWRVTAYDAVNDNWSPASGISSFTVTTPPLLPKLLAPPDNYLAPDSSLAFQFQAVSEGGNTLTYRFEISSDHFTGSWHGFSQSASEGTWDAAATLSGMPVSFSLPASFSLARNRPYQWRVQAWDGVSWSPHSEVRGFSLANTLDIQSVKLYPNPVVSASRLQMDFTPTVDAQVLGRLCNSQAKEIRNFAWPARGGSNNHQTLDISGLAPGAYFIILEFQSAFGNAKTTRRFAVVN